MKNKVDDTPTFDFEAAPGPLDEITHTSSPSVRQPGGMGEEKVGSSPYHPWQEVPQARFLSWSYAMQMSYCAARDLDSAETAHLRGDDPEFYLERAEGYAVEALK